MKKLKESWSRGVSLWLQCLSNVFRNCRVIITEKGYYGVVYRDLVHRDVEVGDEVYILFGCSIPVILREWSWEQHLFLGDCYIEGRMNGEIIESVGGEEEIARKVTSDNCPEMT